MNWHGVAIVVALGLLAAAFHDVLVSVKDPLTQREVVLGDGTKATCVVVQGVRSAGVTCIPHVVVSEDDTVGDEVKP
jgi:hypothetical protein